MVINKEEAHAVKDFWDDKDLPVYNDESKKNGTSFAIKFFLFSFLIFILAAGFAWYSFYNNSSSFSQGKIDFFINAPVSTDSGSDSEISFSITNKNTSPLSEAYLVVTYNSGDSSSGNKNLITQRIDLGEILPNNSINKSISATLFGNEGDSKQIDSTLFYKVPASKAEFNRAGTPINVLIKSSPVSISVDSLKEVHQNDNFQFTITITNNTNKDINNLLVSARTPNDFVYASSSQATYNSNPSWLISKLSANQKQIITFSGKLTGPLGQASSFTFLTGLPKSSANTNSSSPLNNFDNYNLIIDNVYSKSEKTISIAGQYLDVAITSDGTSGSDTVLASDLLYLEFTYKNNLPLPLDNVIFMAKFLGNAIDVDSIDPVGFGSYDPDSNMVVWDKVTMPELSKIPANGTGIFRLKFKIPRDAISGSFARIQIYGKGDRTSEGGVSNQQNLSIDKKWIVK